MFGKHDGHVCCRKSHPTQMTASKNLPAKNAESDKGHNLLRKSFAVLGPGLITGAADDDPSGISTYSVAGSSLRIFHAVDRAAHVSADGCDPADLRTAGHGSGARAGSRGADLLFTLGALGSLLHS